MAGVSHDTLGKAKKIMESADEETKDQLRRGELSIHRAYTALAQAKAQAEADASEPIAGKAEYRSLLTKPIFEHYEPPAYMEPIPFEPVVQTDFSSADEADEADEAAAVPQASPAAERVLEIGCAFLDGLAGTLEGLERGDVERILAIVEDIGEKAVQTAKRYLKEH